MGQTLKWWSAQLTDGQPRWREQKDIYNQRDLTKKGTAIRKTPRSSIGGVSKEKKKNSSSDETRGQTLTASSTTPLMSLFPKDPARPLTKSLQRPVLKPASLSNSLYLTRWVWVHSHLQWKASTPKLGPYNIYIKGLILAIWSCKITLAPLPLNNITDQKCP